MGFNMMIAVRNSDLPLIAEDPGFGQAIHALGTGADYHCYRARENGKEKAYNSPVKLSDIADRWEEARKPYEIFGTVPQHADLDQIVLVTGDGLRVMNACDARLIPFDAWQDLAQVARTLRIESTVKGEYDTRKGGPVDFPNEREITDDWSDEAFENATTVAAILIDGLSCIRDDETFGAHFAAAARRLWKEEKAITDLAEASPDAAKGVWLNDSIGAGHHGNCAQIAGFAPEGRHEIAMVGHNWGRVVRSDAGVRRLTRDHYRELHASDVSLVANTMRGAGFSVQKGCHRMVPPQKWGADLHLDTSYLSEKATAPESVPEDAGPDA